MANIQTITYSEDRILRDDKYNIVTDSAGNLVIPITPIQIEFHSEEHEVNCTCVRIEFSTAEAGLGVDLVKCKTDDNSTISTPAWRLKSTNIHTVYLASRFGNIDPKLPILSYKVYAGIDIECDEEHVDYDSAATYIKISWGDKTIQSAIYEVCHKNKRTFYYGDLHIDLINMTLTYDEQPILLGKENKKCSCGDPTDEIEIYAPYAWCGVHTVPDPVFISGNSHVTYTSGHIYTENENPAIGEYYWFDEEVTIPVYPDQSDSEAIEEYPRKGVIHNVQTREYITTHINGGLTVQLLWRDKDKDQKEGGVTNWITAYKCQKDDDANDNLWVEKRPADANVTGKVWDKVWEGTPADGAGKSDYLATKNIVATDLPWEQKGVKYRAVINMAVRGDDLVREYECDVIYQGMHSFVCNGTHFFQPRFSVVQPDYTTDPIGGTMLYGMLHSDSDRVLSLGEYFDDWAGAVWCDQKAYCDGRYVKYEDWPNGFSDGIIYRELDEGEANTGETGFYYDNKFYILVPSGDVGYVYESADLFAWSTSRCSEQTTMYTKTEEPQPDTEIYNKDGAVMDERVYSKSQSPGVYSINAISLVEGSTVYVKDAKEISIVDEEFE